MIFYSNLGYGIIARLPECENVKTIIYNVVGELSKLFLIYLIIITIVNFLFERKIEKRSETKEFVIPFLENARRPYRQLSLVEDAIIIYRLVRAPERLVFNVDVGNMAPPKAEAYLRKLIQNYWSKKPESLLELNLPNTSSKPMAAPRWCCPTARCLAKA